MKKILTFFAIVLAQAVFANAAETRPNIIFILADDMGYGDVGVYNSRSKISTPNIDKLAASGVRFADAHSGGSVCIPSRYGLLTGRFAARAELRIHSGPVIKPLRATIASFLKRNGYQTAMIGKWHQGFKVLSKTAKTRFDYSQPLQGGPLDRGFASYFGMHASLDIPPYFYIRDRSPTMKPTKKVAANASVGTAENWNHIQGAFWRAGPVSADFKHNEVTPRFAKETINVLRNYAASKKEKPLFLYLALPSPHTPWLPMKKFRGKSKAGMYGDFVMQVDSVVGEISTTLEKQGLAKNTMVIFSSDNGPVWYQKNTDQFKHSSTGILRGMKFSPHEGGHRVPFIVRWPGKTKPGTVSDQTIVFSDMFATFAELVGKKQLPKGTAEDSVSFLPYLIDSTMKPQQRPAIVHDRRTIRHGDWKLILPRGTKVKKGRKPLGELYNLRTDLAEKNNLIEKHPQRAKQMKAQLKAILSAKS